MARSEAAEEPAVAESFYLHDGDSVVFYGDSITEQGNYTRPIEVFSRTRCPEMKVSYLNSGWGGDRAWGGDGGTLDERLRRDVIAHRPTVVTVMLGMNDGYYMNYDPKHVAAFKESIEKLVDKLQQALPGVRITLIGTSPYDNVTPGDQPDWEKSIDGGYNSVVARFSAAARDVAADRGLLFVDMNAPLVELLTQLQASNPELARQLIPDRIHPGAAGGLVMAARLLGAWHAPVSGHSIQIDAATAPNGACRLQQELSLPFTPDRSDPLTALAFKSSLDLNPFKDDTLCATHLPFEKAIVEVGGQEVGQFSAEQLAAGINLVELNSPLTRRASEVARLVDLRNRLQFTRWRNLEVPFTTEQPPSVKQAAAQLTEMEQEVATLENMAASAEPTAIEIRAAEK